MRVASSFSNHLPTVTTKLTRLAFLGLLLTSAAAAPLRAQGPTPEGTIIKNKATATYTDANNNTYASVSDSVSVTVGFAPGVDATSPASVTPASPSTADTIAFQLSNIGNGVDTASVSVTAGSGVTITGYRFGTTTYASLALLNTALASYQFTAGSGATLKVVYDVASGQGGQTIPVSLTMTSKRSPTTTATTTTNVIPPAGRSVAVTPDGATVTQIPSNGAPYSQTFTVTNNGNASDTYSLLAAIGGTPSGAVSIVTVNGVAGTTGSVTLAPAASATITVTYSVSGAVAAGTTDQLTFTATSQTDNTVTNAGDLTVTVAKAAVSMSKTAWMDNQTTQLTGASQVKPGDFLQYKITVSNGASAAAATSVQISDPLPAEVTYVSASGDAAGWTISQSGGTVTASLAGTLAAGGSRFIWVRVQVK